jgi:N-acetylmuramoyl-L-alanine amidase
MRQTRLAALALAVLAVANPAPAQPPGPGPARLAPLAREAIARVAYAEAGDQGDSGLAGVVYTIFNRLADGRWGGSLDAVLNAPHQFEPVTHAGGDWRRLRPVSLAQQARIDTIIDLALDGRLPDLTGGARFFQNRRIVAWRAAAGEVPPALVGFGGAVPTATIGAHTFYAEAGPRSPRPRRLARHAPRVADAPDPATGGAIFVGENRTDAIDAETMAHAPTGSDSQAGLFASALKGK